MRTGPFLSLVLFLSAPLLADTVYTYTGNTFTNNITAPYTSSNYVRGSFTVASPLAPNTIYQTPTWDPTSYIFTDGIDTFSNSFFHSASPNVTVANGPTTGGEIYIETDGSGTIAHWYIYLATAGTSPFAAQLLTADGFGSLPMDLGSRYMPGVEGGVVNWDPGTWTVSTVPDLKPLPPWDSQIIANLPSNFVPLDLLVDSTPVPEPQSMLLLTTGVLGGLVSLRRRISA